MKKGIEVIYKDGSRDWFDPVIDESMRDGILEITIDNGNIYHVNPSDMKSMSYYNADESEEYGGPFND